MSLVTAGMILGEASFPWSTSDAAPHGFTLASAMFPVGVKITNFMSFWINLYIYRHTKVSIDGWHTLLRKKKTKQRIDDICVRPAMLFPVKSTVSTI